MSLKENIHKSNYCIIDELQSAIHEKIQMLIQDECALVINNFAWRIQHCLHLNVRHLEHNFAEFFWHFWFMD